MNFLALDFETANQSRNSACSIGLVKVQNGLIVEKAVHLIKPPTKDFTFTYVHGLSWPDVAQAKTFQQLWPEIAHFFEGIDFVAAHNAPFDKSVIMACLQHCGMPAPYMQFECSLKLSKLTWKLPAYKLSDVCRHLGIDLNHHEALSDALACAKIILRVKDHNP